MTYQIEARVEIDEYFNVEAESEEDALKLAKEQLEWDHGSNAIITLTATPE